jgi:alpha-tubulin suppressor-like RCC1 family protein
MKLKPALASALIAATSLAVAACGGASHHVTPTTPTVAQPAPAPAPLARPVVRGAVYTFGTVGSGFKLLRLEHAIPTRVRGIHGRVIQVATSNSDGYALTARGAVYAWGAGRHGELGDGRSPLYAMKAVRVEFPAHVHIVSLANPMPFDGALGIDSHGHAWGWGLNAAGDLCLSREQEFVPRRIPLDDVTLATGARSHVLFDSDGRVYACGSGTDGVLGDGSTQTSQTPVPVVSLPRDARVVALTSSWEGSGALLSDGSYYDWGFNAGGQLGDGTTFNSDVPVHVQLPGPVRHVFQGGSRAGNGQTLAILADGSVWGWGDGNWGQLGNGTTTSALVPQRVNVPGGVSFAQVNSGGFASYAIDDTGRLWAWGANNVGQLGTGTTVLIERDPVDIGLHLKQISSTSTNVAALGS